MREIVIEPTDCEPALLSDVLLAAGALSVTLDDPDEGTPQESALFGEPGMNGATFGWANNRVLVLVDDTVDPEAWLNAVWTTVHHLQQTTISPLPAWTLRPVVEQDWVRLTQSQFTPILISDTLWIKPSWCQVEATARQQVLEIDPGLAFGTGSHATTFLCLQWLVAYAKAQQLQRCEPDAYKTNAPEWVGFGGSLDATSPVANSVSGARVSLLDYGCGSGILAIAAASLGFDPVQGVDIDPQAVGAARQNAQHNQAKVQFVDAYTALDPAQRFDVVIANILAKPLQVLAELLCTRLAAGGTLVLSGILTRQADEVIAHYAAWLPLEIAAESDGWVCLQGSLKARQ